MVRACAICGETVGIHFWSPQVNQWYCPPCYDPTEVDVAERDVPLLERIERLTKDLKRLRTTHARLVDAVWDVLGDERMFKVLCGSSWQGLKRTLDQIREAGDE